MKMRDRLSNVRLGRDQIFWLVLGVIFLVYALFELDLLLFGITLFSLLVAITIHEFAHAWTAEQLGDPTARSLGRVSLNPLAHLDPLGSLVMLMSLVSGIGIGWGKPVPISPYRLRFGPRRGGALVALSGPAANLLMATVIGLVTRLLFGVSPWILLVLNTLVWVNVIIAIFNLIPLPPLDGSAILLGILSLVRARWSLVLSEKLVGLQRHGPIILFLVIIVSQFLGLGLVGRLIGAPSRLIYRLITGA